MQESIAPDGSLCRVANPDQAGIPVVLIHGLGLNQSMWEHQIGALAAGSPVVTYDLYGHGGSVAPPSTPSLSQFAVQFKAVMTHLGLDRAIIAGFSLGGMIVRRIAMDYPQMVMGLAILHSPHARTKEQHDAIQLRVHHAACEGPSATIDAALERWFTKSFHEQNPDVMDQVRHMVLANDPAVYPSIYQVLVDGVDELVAPQPAIKAPALVMTGDEDFGNNPAMSKAIAAEIACADEASNAELVILPGLRHMAMLEAPDIFNPHLVRFCEQISRQHM